MPHKPAGRVISYQCRRCPPRQLSGYEWPETVPNSETVRRTSPNVRARVPARRHLPRLSLSPKYCARSRQMGWRRAVPRRSVTARRPQPHAGFRNCYGPPPLWLGESEASAPSFGGAAPSSPGGLLLLGDQDEATRSRHGGLSASRRLGAELRCQILTVPRCLGRELRCQILTPLCGRATGAGPVPGYAYACSCLRSAPFRPARRPRRCGRPWGAPTRVLVAAVQVRRPVLGDPVRARGWTPRSLGALFQRTLVWFVWACLFTLCGRSRVLARKTATCYHARVSAQHAVRVRPFLTQGGAVMGYSARI